MPQILLVLCTLISFVYLCVCATLFIFQRKLIYYPQARTISTQENTQTLAIEYGKLVLTVQTHAGPDAVIYFGGNGEDVSLSLPSLQQAFPQRALYLLHYRGFGGSDGAPSEAALHADAAALFAHVHASHQRITVIGRSLGTGVAIRLVNQLQRQSGARAALERLVLVTPYDSLQELAVQQFPYVPIRWLLHDKFESWRYAADILVPTTILQAEHDEVIPSASTRLLFSRFGKDVAHYTVIAHSSHNSILDSPYYVPALGQHAAPETVQATQAVQTIQAIHQQTAPS